MSEDKELVEKKLLAILEEAILEEQASTARYRHGAMLARDPEIIALFEKLTADELEHEKALKTLYYQTKKKLGLKVLGGEEG